MPTAAAIYQANRRRKAGIKPRVFRTLAHMSPEQRKAETAAYLRDYQQKNKEAITTSRAAYYAVNKGRAAARTLAQRKARPYALMLSSAKSRAKKFGREFDLTAEDIHVPTHCPVFGTELILGASWDQRWDGPSLDRIENHKGYVKGNVIVVSLRANTLKGNATVPELRALADFYSRLAGAA